MCMSIWNETTEEGQTKARDVANAVVGQIERVKDG
jgi:hypothetical protein